jgi:hypothetical protein
MSEEYFDVNQWRDTPNGKRATKIGFAKMKRDNDGFYVTLDALPLPQLFEGKLTCQISIDKQKPRPSGGYGGGGARMPARADRAAQATRRTDDGDEVPF